MEQTQEMPHITKGLRNAYSGLLDVQRAMALVQGPDVKADVDRKGWTGFSSRATTFATAAVVTGTAYSAGWGDAIRREIEDFKKPWNIKNPFRIPTRDEVADFCAMLVITPIMIIGGLIMMTFEPVKR